MPTFFDVHAPDRLLLGRLGGKAGREAAAESCERSQFAARTESLFEPALTACSQGSENFSETGDNDQVQTHVCGAEEARTVGVAARPGRGAGRRVWRYRQPRRGRPKRAAGRGRRAPLLGDRGEGAR
jgi:hypothetical protein